MSINDFALLTPNPHSDHFASSFLHNYHHQPYDTDRFIHPAPAAPYLRNPQAPTYHLDYPSYPQQQQPIRGFDPRPPHAGWTPKEEVDDDEQSRDLLTRRHSPADSLLTGPTTPDEQSSPQSHHAALAGAPGSGASAHSKTYSFVSLPGNAVRKRPRRRYDEIERLYACAWPDCTKAYGTLNHLNAHVSMQRHGPKRSPAEFKELRKQWRQQKKQEAAGFSAPSSAPVPVPAPVPSSHGGQEPIPRRRNTEPSLSLPHHQTLHHHHHHQLQHAHSHPHALHQHSHSLPSHAQALGHQQSHLDTRFQVPHSSPSPTSTSTASDSTYWHDSPLSPVLNVSEYQRAASAYGEFHEQHQHHRRRT